MLRLNTAWGPPRSGISFKTFSGPHIHAGLGDYILIKDQVIHFPLRADPERVDRLHQWLVDSLPRGAQRTGIGGHFPRTRPVGLPFL